MGQFKLPATLELTGNIIGNERVWKQRKVFYTTAAELNKTDKWPYYYTHLWKWN